MEDVDLSNVTELLTDSRRLSYPETTLFFALKTDTNDGHRYIRELYDMRVRRFVVNSLPADAASMPDAVFYRTDDVLGVLHKIAAEHRDSFDIPVVGITGSNGKTVVKEFLYQMLKDDLKIVRSPRSYNSQTGVPLSVWKMDASHEFAIFEAGISLPGEMEKLQRIIRPDIGVFTNLGNAHQENFISMHQKAMEKLKLFKDCSTIIYNEDDTVLSCAVEDSGLKARRFVWSRKNNDSDLFVRSISKSETSSVVCVVFKGVAKDYRIPFTDDANIEDAIHCIAVISCLRPDIADDTERFSRLEPVAMRMELKQGRYNSMLINDSYSSDLDSLAIALDFQMNRRKGRDYKTTVILSDIFQSGYDPHSLYSSVAQILKAKGAERLVGIGHDIICLKGLFDGESEFYSDTDEFLASAAFESFRNELILLKGAREFHFERIVERMELRLHETIMEVNLDALVHNFNWYRAKLKPQTKMVCMVKASAYGAGAVEIAKTLQEHRCDYLAVAVADEGIDLRNEGIILPVMVMNPEMSSLGMLFEYALEPEIYSFRLLESIIGEASAKGIKSYPIHIKIDTGMHRLGFSPDEMDKVCEILNGQNAVTVKSVFSHLAGSDSPEFSDFTAMQLERFSAASQYLESHLGYKVIKHILNSAGIERYTDFQMDMVRLGIGLYGVSASGLDGLRNVSTLKTTILQIRDVPSGDSIGYSRRSYVERDSRIAVIPIGYADGLDRHLSNGVGQVLVNGMRAPIIGNICMDACMIDVTGINASEGDTVVIFGDDMPVSEIADRLGTIPYEILTSPSPRVSRVYFRE